MLRFFVFFCIAVCCLMCTRRYEYFPWAEKHVFLSSVDGVYNSVRVLFLIVLAFSLVSVVRMRSDHAISKITLLAIFALRMVPSILVSIKFGTVSDSAGPSIVQIVGDGLYLAILTSDLIIAKIASRQVHVLVPVIALASVISHHVSIVAAFIYHITIIYDLCTYLQVHPMLRLYQRATALLIPCPSGRCWPLLAASIATECSTCCTSATWRSSARRFRSPMETISLLE